MKKLLLALVFGVLVLLSACSKPVTIIDGHMDVIFDNVRYEGSTIVVDVWITNGTDESIELNTGDFWFELPEGTDLGDLTSNEVCGANFDLFDNVYPDEYVEYTLSFEPEFIFLSESELSALGVTLADLEFYYSLN